MNDNTLRSVVIVGSGNVAEALAYALSHSSFELRQIFARNVVRGAEVARVGRTEWTDNPAHLACADLYLIAVSDRAVSQVAASLPLPAEAVVAHTTGCLPLEALPAHHPQRAVIYPFQTFTAERRVDFSEIPLFIEASTPAVLQQIDAFAHGLSRSVLPADSAQRACIHLAGVFACNFANQMFACGEQLLREAGLGYDILRPIICETAAKALDASTPAAVQTGPAVRGDLETQERHRHLLNADTNLETIYKSISKLIWETSKKI